MNARRFPTICLALALVALAPAGRAETIPFDLEVGFRWLDVDGNEDVYKTQINEDDGFLLRSFTLLTNDFNTNSDWLDHVRIDVSELGAGPAGFLRLQAGRADRYELKLTWRQAEMYSALPALANPFLDQGIIPGQHTIDRDRTTLDLDLELRPWERIVPFIGYTRFQNEGPGATTYTLGGDDFRLHSDLDEEETELRAGVAFRFDRFFGQVTQGWRNLESDEVLSLAPGAGEGNSPGTVLGRPVGADVLTRSSSTEVDTPFTSAHITGVITDRIRLIGEYISFEAETDGSESEVAEGSFVSFGLRRFFEGLQEDVVSDAENNTSRVGLRAEIALADRLDFIAGYQQRDRELKGSALIASLYLDTLTFGNADPRDLEELLSTDSSLDTEQDTLNFGFRARSLGPFAVWGYVSRTDQDVTLTPDLSEIVVPGSQGGDFERSIDSLDIGASFSRAGFTASASWRGDDADRAVLRTDFRDRDLIRLRAGWVSPARRFRVGLSGQHTDQSNDREGIDYDAEIQQLTATFEVAPIESIHLWTSWSGFDADTHALIRRPETFEIVPSLHEEDGDSWEAGARWFRNPFGVEASWGRFDNDGTNPFEMDRWRTRVQYEINEQYGVAGEWARDTYDELSLPLANYEADRFGLFLRWHP
ncbi:MAG TPA: porin [Thermoanaerobaculia bacterium]|nr:porin [Thermoanaerobaculia bacterium]